MKNINADYYGYRDEDDGVLCLMEQEKEKKRWFICVYIHHH